MPTTARGIEYPLSTDAPRVWEDMQAMADSIETAIDTATDRPVCYIVQGTAQTGWTTATFTTVTFAGTDDLDTDDLHDPAVNNSRILIGTKLGWWRVSGLYTPAANSATTLFRAAIAKNGTRLTSGFVGVAPSSSSGLMGLATGTVYVEATSSGDYIELQGYQAAASGTIGTGVSSDLAPSLSAEWVRVS